MRYTHTRLLVRDFAACFRFYRDVMGFRPTFGDENDVYADFETGTIVLALFGRGDQATAIGADDQPEHADMQDTICLCFDVEDVDQMVAQLEARGVTFIAPPTDRPGWGLRTAHLRDPDGNLIEISHGIPMSE